MSDITDYLFEERNVFESRMRDRMEDFTFRGLRCRYDLAAQNKPLSMSEKRILLHRVDKGISDHHREVLYTFLKEKQDRNTVEEFEFGCVVFKLSKGAKDPAGLVESGLVQSGLKTGCVLC